jgi:hypothetical protein
MLLDDYDTHTSVLYYLMLLAWLLDREILWYWTWTLILVPDGGGDIQSVP